MKSGVAPRMTISTVSFYCDGWQTSSYTSPFRQVPQKDVKGSNFNRWRKNINRISLQRGNNTEGVGWGEVLKNSFFGDKYTTLFLYNGLYVHIKLVGSKNKKNKRSLEKAYTSERWSALDNSQKWMSAYVFIQNRFSNNIWVVQIFFSSFSYFYLRFKLVDYFHKQFACEIDWLLSYSQYYTIRPKPPR